EEDVALALEIASGMALFWQLRGRTSEARQFLGALVDAEAGHPAGRLRALTLAAACAYNQDDPRQALAWVDEAPDIARDGAPAELAAALHVRGLLALVSDDLTAAEACFEEALTLCRDGGDLAGEAQALTDLGLVTGLRDQLDEAGSLFRRSLDIRTRLGAREEGHVTLTSLALPPL